MKIEFPTDIVEEGWVRFVARDRLLERDYPKRKLTQDEEERLSDLAYILMDEKTYIG